MKSSLISRMKKIEAKLTPIKSRSVYKYTFDDWTMDDIRKALFGTPSPACIEKWNATDWCNHRAYLHHLSVDELQTLEQMIINRELWCGA